MILNRQLGNGEEITQDKLDAWVQNYESAPLSQCLRRETASRSPFSASMAPIALVPVTSPLHQYRHVIVHRQIHLALSGQVQHIFFFGCRWFSVFFACRRHNVELNWRSYYDIAQR